MFSNDYVSELIWNRTRACCTPSRRYTRCSCWSGPCELCKLFNFNFNHVTEAEAASTWRHMLSWSYHLSLQLKTGVKSTPTSQIKELGAIYTFGIKKLINLDKIQNENETNDGSLAMRMNFGLLTSVVGSGQPTETNFVLTRTRKMIKWSHFKSLSG